MKREMQILSFLEDNYTMINSLMSDKESKMFQGDVVKFIMRAIKIQIAKEAGQL